MNSAHAVSELDCIRGAVVGLGIGDAVGAALEGAKPPITQPISDMVGGIVKFY